MEFDFPDYYPPLKLDPPRTLEEEARWQRLVEEVKKLALRYPIRMPNPFDFPHPRHRVDDLCFIGRDKTTPFERTEDLTVVVLKGREPIKESMKLTYMFPFKLYERKE